MLEANDELHIKICYITYDRCVDGPDLALQPREDRLVEVLSHIKARLCRPSMLTACGSQSH